MLRTDVARQFGDEVVCMSIIDWKEALAPPNLKIEELILLTQKVKMLFNLRGSLDSLRCYKMLASIVLW